MLHDKDAQQLIREACQLVAETKAEIEQIRRSAADARKTVTIRGISETPRTKSRQSWNRADRHPMINAAIGGYARRHSHVAHCVNNVALWRETIKAEKVSGWPTYLLGMSMLIGVAIYQALLAGRRYRKSQVWQFRASQTEVRQSHCWLCQPLLWPNISGECCGQCNTVAGRAAFTAIDNTSSEPITGAFGDLRDGGRSQWVTTPSKLHVWVTNIGTEKVAKLRRATGSVQKVYQTEGYPVGVVFDGTSIWIANSDSDTVTKITP